MQNKEIAVGQIPGLTYRPPALFAGVALRMLTSAEYADEWANNNSKELS